MSDICVLACSWFVLAAEYMRLNLVKCFQRFQKETCQSKWLQMFEEMDAPFKNDHLGTLISGSKKFRVYPSVCARSSFFCTRFHLCLCVSWLCVRGWDCVSGSWVTLKDRWRGRFTANYFQLNGPWWAGWTTTKCLQETSILDKPAPPSRHGCHTEAAANILLVLPSISECNILRHNRGDKKKFYRNIWSSCIITWTERGSSANKSCGKMWWHHVCLYLMRYSKLQITL